MEAVGNDMPSLSLEEYVAITTLVRMHENENAYQWEEFVNMIWTIRQRVMKT